MVFFAIWLKGPMICCDYTKTLTKWLTWGCFLGCSRTQGCGVPWEAQAGATALGSGLAAQAEGLLRTTGRPISPTFQ